MYDFLLTGVFWVDAIISALITGGVTLIVSYIAYQYNIRKIRDNTDSIKNKCDKLSDNQGNLSKEHSGLSKEHSELLVSQRLVQTTVSKINEGFLEEKGRTIDAISHLSDSQKEVREAVSKVGYFAKLYDDVVIKNNELNNKLKIIETDLSRREAVHELMTKDNIDINMQIYSLTEKNKSLNEQISNLKVIQKDNKELKQNLYESEHEVKKYKSIVSKQKSEIVLLQNEINNIKDVNPQSSRDYDEMER